MDFLSEDDVNIRDLAPEELIRAWEFWFALAQLTNEYDPPYSHGILAGTTWEDLEEIIGKQGVALLKRSSTTHASI